MNRNQVNLTLERKLITGIKLFATHSANLTIYLHKAVLNEIFGFTAGCNSIRKLQSAFQLDKFRMNHHRNVVFLFMNRNFHNNTLVLNSNRQNHISIILLFVCGGEHDGA